MFSGKTIIITGGTRGIGRGVALELAKLNANLVLTYIGNDDAAKETEKKIANSNYIIVKGNIKDLDFATSVIKDAEDKFGNESIYGLVNNAGITNDKLLLRMSDTDFMDVIDVNLKGAFNMLKAITPKLSKNKAGRIVNLSSIVGVRGNAGQINYSSSKAGIIGLTLSAAKELGGRNITVNAIAPGMIETDMTDVLSDEQKDSILKSISLKRFGDTNDIGNLVSFLLSEKASYITGQVIGIDGGMII